MLQIFNALAFIHAKHLSHLAIKPQNILFEDNTLKITDFGMSQKINKPVDSKIDLQSLSSSSVIKLKLFEDSLYGSRAIKRG